MTSLAHEIVEADAVWLQLVGRAQSEIVLAVLDACNSPLIQDIVTDFDDVGTCLYNGRSADDFWAIAPHLVPCSSQIIRRLRENETDKNWGFVIICDLDFQAVRRHLRKYLQAVLPDGKQVYFRFYDPRVLWTYLNASSAEDLAMFLSPFREIYIPAPDGRVRRLICVATADSTSGQVRTDVSDQP